MAAFIKKDNQELLWNTINKSELFIKHLQLGSLYNPTEWFKNIIQKFYYENKKPNLSYSELKELNRNVLLYMLNELRNIHIQPMSPPKIETFQEKASNLPLYNEKKQDSYSYQLELRQREYDMMNEKSQPPKPEFVENMKDEAISNMDELIKKHLEDRERELKVYRDNCIPLDTIQQETHTFSEDPPIKVNIDSTNESNITLQIDEIVPINKKTVTWKEDTINDEIKSLKDEIEEFRLQIKLLHNKMDRMLNSVNNIPLDNK